MLITENQWAACASLMKPAPGDPCFLSVTGADGHGPLVLGACWYREGKFLVWAHTWLANRNRDQWAELVPHLQEIEIAGKVSFVANYGLSSIAGIKARASDIEAKSPVRRVCLDPKQITLPLPHADLVPFTGSHDMVFSRAARTFSHLVRHGRVTHDGCPMLRYSLSAMRLDQDFCGDLWLAKPQPGSVPQTAVAAILATNQAVGWVRKGIELGYLPPVEASELPTVEKE
jgi:phage terminase large subunit-like protein